jgi:hypothetical protein
MLSEHICNVHSTLFADTIPEAILYEAVLSVLQC